MKVGFEESKLSGDHKLSSDESRVEEVEGNRVVTRNVPALTAINARLRDDYIQEVQAGLDRWNRIPAQFGIPFRCVLPHIGFQRKIGNFAGYHIDPAGEVMTGSEGDSRRDERPPR